MSSDYNKPLPVPSPVTQEFWRAARRHELVLQRCQACERYIYYPRALCPYCLSDDLRWTPVSGRGTVYSFTVARRPTASVFADWAPFVIAVVELDEGPRMTTNIVGCAPEEVRIGMAVEAAFEDVTDDVTLVKFRPAGDSR